MQYSSVDDLIKRDAAVLQEGPLAIVLVEDDVEVDTTLR